MFRSLDGLPKEIYVSGNPIHLRGFNGKYVRRENKKTEMYEYHQDEHTLTIGFSPFTWHIYMRPTKIVRMLKYGKWCLMANDNQEDNISMFHVKQIMSETPLGDWGGILVTQNENMGTWWRNNGIYIINIITFFIIIFLYIFYFR